jgi:hypothetical protein
MGGGNQSEAISANQGNIFVKAFALIVSSGKDEKKILSRKEPIVSKY